MLHHQSRYAHWVAALATLTLVLFAGCAKKPPTNELVTGLLLRYAPPESGAMRYAMSKVMKQEMEVMGQSITTTVDRSCEFTLAYQENRDGNLSFLATLDSFSVAIESPMMNLTPDVDDLLGKRFGLLLSPFGHEIELTGADTISYEMGAGERSTIASDFALLFPNLPEEVADVGVSWMTMDTLIVAGGGTDMSFLFEKVNTLTGFETMAGLDCAVITASVGGVISGSGEKQGIQVAFDGTYQGADTWYFAYREGRLVNVASDGTATVKITTSGAQAMEIPMTMKFDNDIVWVE